MTELLKRTRCRIPWGNPGENGENWASTSMLPMPERIGNFPQVTVSPYEVRALADADALYVRFDCPVDPITRLQQQNPYHPIGSLEHAWIRIYPVNSCSEHYLFQLDYKGLSAVTRHRRINGECSCGHVPDQWNASGPVEIQWKKYFGLTPEGWWCEFIITWDSLDLSGCPPVFGFEYGRQFRTGLAHPELCDTAWPPVPLSIPSSSLKENGEALVGNQGGTPVKLDLPPLRFGKNCGTLTLGKGWPEKPVFLKVRTSGPDGTVICQKDYPAKGNKINIEFFLDRTLTSHVYPFSHPALELNITGRNQEPLYQVRLPVDRHLGLCVDEPYGEPGSFRPPPGRRASFRDKLLDQVARKLPRLHRRNTTQNAPSDFCLAYNDSRIAVNLMDENVWPQLAKMVSSRFTSSVETLAGAMLLVAQKSVANYILGPLFFSPDGKPVYHTTMEQKMGPASIVRYGGGPAVAQATVLARLLQELEDPETGCLYQTRILALQKDGGPKPPKRPYPFETRRGPVGAVIVEVGNILTILDPTNLVIFLKTPELPASLEEILTDSNICKEGAGRMADVYAKLDIEEILRVPINQRLTNGVFPELAADEDRPDQPFAPQERQLIRALTMTAKRERKTGISGFVDEFRLPGKRDGSIAFQQTPDALQIRINVKGIGIDQMTERDLAMEQVHIALDTHHDHTTFHRFMVNARNQCEHTLDKTGNIQTLFKHQSTTHYDISAPIENRPWKGSLKQQKNGYTAEFIIPWGTLHLHLLPTVIGFNAWITGQFPVYETVSLSPSRFTGTVDAFSFSDLYIAIPSVIIEEINLGIPVWGPNVAKLRLYNPGQKKIRVSLEMETRSTICRRTVSGPAVSCLVPRGGTVDMNVPFRFAQDDKMFPQQLTLRGKVRDVEVYRASWTSSYCGNISVYHAYGSELEKIANPRPGTKDFVEKKIRFICSRIPIFQRLTTRDGARSDFILRAEDESVEFNLMEAGVLGRMATFIAERFSNDLDRILGIFFLSHAPGVVRHMSWGHQIMVGVDPLSLIRGNFAGGGGNCGYHSRAFGGMACHLKLENGQYLIAHGSVPVWGHVISAIGIHGNKSLIDADVGHFFLTPDGLDLATVDEFRNDPLRVLTTAGPSEIGRYYATNEEMIRSRPSMLGEPFRGTFPPDAPVE